MKRVRSISKTKGDLSYKTRTKTSKGYDIDLLQSLTGLDHAFVMRRSGVRLSSVAQEETIRFIDKKASNYGGFLVYIELKRFEKNIV